jgi:hypothetical protein
MNNCVLTARSTRTPRRRFPPPGCPRSLRSLGAGERER